MRKRSLLKNPFKRSDNNDKRTPEGEPLEHVGSGSVMGSKKLVIVAVMATFIVIILVMSESVVMVQAGHRGVVLYAGAVENRVLTEGSNFHNTICRAGHTFRRTYTQI